jgi:hypothetical protein
MKASWKKVVLALSALILMAEAGISSRAQHRLKATLVPKYTALVRKGDATQESDYTAEKRDAQGNLLEVDVQCSLWIHYPLPLRGMNELIVGQPGFEHGASVADSACLIEKQYRVWSVPEQDKPLRCVVQHVPVSVMQGCFKFQPAE